MEILRYFGIGKEATFGTKVDPVFFSRVFSSGLDSPENPVIKLEDGLGQFYDRYVPGAYISGGSVEIPVTVSTLWYLLWLALGSKSTDSSGVTSVSDEATAADGNGVIDVTLANTPVVYGSVKIYDSGDGLIASDDGCGKIVEENASGVSGTVDYVTGALYATGVTPDEACTTDYEHGQYKHTITCMNDIELPTATVRLGKDAYEHVFPACALGGISLKVEREMARLSMEITGGPDEPATLKTYSDLKFPPDKYQVFHSMKFEYADKDGSYSDVSAKVNALTLSAKNNADAEAGLGLNSRYPGKIYAGARELSVELTLKFEGKEHKEDFWGGAGGPTTTPTEKKCKITLDSGGAAGYGDTTIEAPRALIRSAPHQPSGRDRMEETLALDIMRDLSTWKSLEVVANVLANYS